jgi:phthiocerol/phenolphthiocerol synthesis type-I polyketide synthase E
MTIGNPSVAQDSDNRDQTDSIAIIGMSARMPGSPDLNAFWTLLRDGKEAIVQFSKEEMLGVGADPDVVNHEKSVAAKGYLADVDLFDASFFGISPREAELIDPQHRVMLECAWEAMEGAGYDPAQYPGRVAIFTSAGMNTYLAFNILTNPGLMEQVGGFQLSIYNDKDFVPTRIAYSMNTHGPAIDIGTACSSSLVGVHMACQHLLTYQSDMVLVGGVTVHLPQKTAYVDEGGTAYSPDGHCRPFDATPSGLVDGNGAAAVVLKRLSDAIADGDHIHAVIRGSAINNDGSDKIGYSAPSIDGQAEVILEAQAMAGVLPEEISYVEAHGTATPLGDPIEVAALTQAFRTQTDLTGYCGLGAVKSNIGHVDKAAGLAGLIKTALSLEHEQLVPTLHWQAPNPKLDLPNTPFYIVNTLKPWPRQENKPRIAALSSFGVGGTNAHAILAEAPLVQPGSSSRANHLLVLSARTESALNSSVQRLVNHLTEHPTCNLADVTHTLQRGRKRFSHRLSLSVKDIQEAIQQLPNTTSAFVESSSAPEIVFLFPGQGSQYSGMGRELYQHEPLFTALIDQCAEFLEPLIGQDIRAVLFPLPEAQAQAQEMLKNTSLTQPALFALEYALARVWMRWGVAPKAMIGHSLGEYVAACLAGVFSLEDGLTLVSIRSRLMQSMPPGAMLSVPLAEHKVMEQLTASKISLDIAAVNGPALTVVSGTIENIDAFKAHLLAQNVNGTVLQTSHAFHSSMMEPMLESFSAQTRHISFQAPQIPYISNLTGTWITAAQVTDPNYWREHIRQTVRFSAGIQTLLHSDKHAVLLEIGPGRTLTSLASIAVQENQRTLVVSLPTAQATIGAQAFMLTALGQLWCAGVAIDWAGFYENESRLRVPLPTYPFERQKFWIQPGGQKSASSFAQNDARRRKNPDDWFYLPGWVLSQSPNGKATPNAQRFSLYGPSSPLASLLRDTLAKQGHTVSLSHTHDECVVSSKDCDTLVYLPILNGSHTADGDKITRTLSTVCDPLIKLVQAISAQRDDRPLRLAAISEHVLATDPSLTIEPAQAALLGMMRTLNYEFTHFDTQTIDIITPTTTKKLSRLCEKLTAELVSETCDSTIVLHNSNRWIPELRPIHPEERDPALGIFKAHCVYVITDGLEDIGLVFAKALAKLPGSKMVLTAQSSATLTRRQAEIESLRALGASVEAVELKEISTQSLSALLERVQEKWQAIDVFIHAVDMHSKKPFGLIQALDEQALSTYWNAQQNQLLELETALEKHEVNLCMVMSSLTAQISGTGQVAHTVAALHLEAFAHQHNQRHDVPWMVIQWDSWKAENTAKSELSARTDLPLSPEEGMQAFERLMKLDEMACVTIATNPPMARREQILRQQKNSASGPATSSEDRLYERPYLSNPYVAPRNEYEQSVAQTWQKCLGIKQIGVEDNFFDLGGHSLLGAQLTLELQYDFKVNVDIALLFAHPTVAQLSQALLDKQLENSDTDQLAAQLDCLESMTDEEVEALLASGELSLELLEALGTRDSVANHKKTIKK